METIMSRLTVILFRGDSFPQMLLKLLPCPRSTLKWVAWLTGKISARLKWSSLQVPYSSLSTLSGICPWTHTFALSALLRTVAYCFFLCLDKLSVVICPLLVVPVPDAVDNIRAKMSDKEVCINFRSCSYKKFIHWWRLRIPLIVAESLTEKGVVSLVARTAQSISTRGMCFKYRDLEIPA